MSYNNNEKQTVSEAQLNLDTELSGFIGTEQYYRHITNLLYTDGVQFLAETFGTYWLIDKILTQIYLFPNEDFQVWILERIFNNTFKLSMEDGNDNVIHSEIIEFSDFAPDKVSLYYQTNVLFLPSEY